VDGTACKLLIDQAVKQAVDKSVQLVVAWSQLAICGLAALVLLSIWRRGYWVSHDENARDQGILWFAAALGVWSFIGLVQVVRLTSQPNDWVAGILRTFLSIANSVCLIGAGVHLDAYKEAPPDFLAPFIRSFRERLWLWTALIVTPVFIILAMFGLHTIVDVVVSVLILTFLLYGFFISFRRRHFPILAYASVAVLLFEITAQIPELSQISALKPAFKIVPLLWLAEIRWPLLLISKVMVVLLVIALAFSWIHERGAVRISQLEAVLADVHAQEQAISSALREELAALRDTPRSRACLKILAPHYDPSEKRTVFQVFFRWSGEVKRTIDLEERLYLRVLELALERIRGKQPEGWIQGKNLLGAVEDNTVNVRQDFSDILEKSESRIDPIFESRDRGSEKRVCADPGNIAIEIEDLLHTSHSWKKGTVWTKLSKALEDIKPTHKGVCE